MEVIRQIVNYSGAAGAGSLLAFPSIVGTVIEIRSVDWTVAFVTGSADDMSIALVHNLQLARAGTSGLLAIDGPETWYHRFWELDPATKTQIQPTLYLNPPFEVAGPQAISIPESGLTSAVFDVTVYFTRRSGLAALRWAEMLDRTSYDRS